MKLILITCFSSIALSLAALGQTPSPTATASPSATASPTPTVALATAAAAPAVSVSPAADAGDELETAIKNKVHRHLGVTVGGHAHKTINFDGDDNVGAAWMAVPIVGVIFTTLFGAPVMIVAIIMFFSYLKSRSLHRTVKAMVDAGQVVPAELFSGPTRTVKAHSDLRRAVIWITTGIGMMIFFGAVSSWDSSGPWVIGFIPFVIGAAYLLLGKLEASKHVPPTVS